MPVLCAFCRAMLWQPIPSHGYINGDHQQTIQSLRESASKKCQVCSLASFSLDKATNLAPDAFTGYELETSSSNKLTLKIFLEQYRTVTALLAAFDLVPMNADLRVGLETLSTSNTSSDHSFKVAGDWLDSCVRRHLKCKQGTRKGWVPRRLIHIEPTDGQGQLHLEVVEDHKGDKPYLTLSHCWGAAKVTRLQSANLESMCTGTTLETLPKTFRDAVLITKRLGFEYLWIDSLCIIQDSKKDWATEAALMGEVYKNSHLNIAATGAIDSSGGCFFDRDAIKILPQSVSVDHEITVKGTSDTRMERQAYCLVDRTPSLRTRLDEAVLNCRAWVMQERILAPRILYFAREQLFWECREVEACEAYPDGLGEDLAHDEPCTTSVPFEQTNQAAHDPRTYQPLYSKEYTTPFQHWAAIVERYTRGGLTVLQDKLIALAGIVLEMRRLLDDDDVYLGGMWRQSLMHELLWVANETSFRPRGIFRAPSWSWASVEGAISYKECLGFTSYEWRQVLATVEDVHVDGPDVIHGHITSGSLTLRCSVGVSICKRRSPELKRRDYGFTDVANWTGEEDLNMMLNSKAPIFSSSGVAWDDDINSVERPHIVFLVPLFRLEDLYFFGLVLGRHRDGTFHRLGRFEVSAMHDPQAGIDLQNKLRYQTITIV